VKGGVYIRPRISELGFRLSEPQLLFAMVAQAVMDASIEKTKVQVCTLEINELLDVREGT
jgi:hypothetical protein